MHSSPPRPVSAAARFFRAALVALLAATVSSVSAKPERWENDIAAFEKADASEATAPGGVVFMGSSSIRLWKTLASDFPALAPINRGFGGCELSDVAYFFERLVQRRKPSLLVVYAGENDLAGGVPPEDVLESFRKLRTEAKRLLPGTPMIYLSIKPSPKRQKVWEEVRKANLLIEKECGGDAGCRFVDVQSVLLDDKGEPSAKWFADDGVHLNPNGYALWTRILTPLLDERARSSAAN